MSFLGQYGQNPVWVLAVSISSFRNQKKRGVGGRETRERPIILNVPVAQSAKTLWDIPHGEKEKTRGTFLLLLPCSQLWSTQWCHLISGCYPASQHPIRMFAATFPLEKLIFCSPKNKPTPFFKYVLHGYIFFPLSSSALVEGQGMMVLFLPLPASC